MRRLLLAASVLLLAALPTAGQAQSGCFYVRAWSNAGPFYNDGGGVVWVTQVQCTGSTVTFNDPDVSRDFSALLRRDLGTDFVSGGLASNIVVVTGSDLEGQRARYIRDQKAGVEIRTVTYSFVADRIGTGYTARDLDATRVCFYARASNLWTIPGTLTSVKRAYVTPVQCSDRRVFDSNVMLQFRPQLVAADPEMGRTSLSASAWVFTSPNEAERRKSEWAGQMASSGYEVRDFPLDFDERGLPPLSATAPGLSGATTPGTIATGPGGSARVQPQDPEFCYAAIWIAESEGLIIPPYCYRGTVAPSATGMAAQLRDWAYLNNKRYITDNGQFRFIERNGFVPTQAAYDTTLARMRAGQSLFVPSDFRYAPIYQRRPSDVDKINAMQTDAQIVSAVDALLSPLTFFRLSGTFTIADLERSSTNLVGLRIRPFWFAERLRVHGYSNISKDGAVPSISGERVNNWTRIAGGELLYSATSANHVWFSLGAAKLDYTVRTGNGTFWNEQPGGTVTEFTGGMHLDVNGIFGGFMRYGSETGFAIGGRFGIGEVRIRSVFD